MLCIRRGVALAVICYSYPIDRVRHGVPELWRGQPRGEEVLRRLWHAPARALHCLRGREPSRQEVLCRLRRGALTIGASSAPADTASPLTAAPTSSAERRQLTVLFCDLVGSTALA